MRPPKFLMQSDVERAMANTQSNAQAARFCDVNYITYKKYASRYKDSLGNNLFEIHKNQAGKDMIKPRLTVRDEKHSLEDVLNNLHPGYELQQLKDRLLSNGYMKQECQQCGFNEKRVTDSRTPLLLSFKDEPNNYNIENLILLCLNCHFLMVGDIRGRRSEIKYFLKQY